MISDSIIGTSLHRRSAGSGRVVGGGVVTTVAGTVDAAAAVSAAVVVTGAAGGTALVDDGAEAAATLATVDEASVSGRLSDSAAPQAGSAHTAAATPMLVQRLPIVHLHGPLPFPVGRSDAPPRFRYQRGGGSIGW